MEPRLGRRRLIRLGGDIALQFWWLFGLALIGSCSTPTRISPLQFVLMHNLLDDDARRTSKQRTGFKNAMLADIRPLTDDRTHEVTFSLMPKSIHQIFAEKPVLPRTFLNFVPRKIMEKDFCTKHNRGEYLHKTKNSVAAAAEATEDEELAVFLKHDDILANGARCRHYDVQLLLVKDHGKFCDGTKETTDAENELSKRTLSQDLNRQAAVVLEGRALG